MEQYEIDICNADLVKYVHQRPPLWDNRSAEYKNHDKRKYAWAEVFPLIVGVNWTCLMHKQQHMIGEITKRWRSLRDHLKKDVNSERKVASGSASAAPRRHHRHDMLSFLIPSMAMRTTQCSTAGPRTATQESEALRQAQELDICTEQPTSPPATVAARRDTFPSLRTTRQWANRVEISDLITTTNSLVASLNRSTDQQITQLQRMDTDLRCLQQSVDQFFLQEEEEDDDSMFLMGTLHSIRMIHPTYKQQARIDIHHLIGNHLSRRPPSTPRASSSCGSSYSCRNARGKSAKCSEGPPACVCLLHAGDLGSSEHPVAQSPARSKATYAALQRDPSEHFAHHLAYASDNLAQTRQTLFASELSAPDFDLYGTNGTAINLLFKFWFIFHSVF